MRVGHHASLCARRKKTLSAEDLGTSYVDTGCTIWPLILTSGRECRWPCSCCFLPSPGRILLLQSGATENMLLDSEGPRAGLSGNDQAFSGHSTSRPRNGEPNGYPLKSDLSSRTRVSRRPTTVYFGDIELYLLRNPDGGE